MFLDSIETNLKKEAEELVRQLREIMYEHLDLTETESVDNIKFYKKNK